jgi:hypothetical protein
MSPRDRRRARYGIALFAVIAGALCAAALTNGVGNTVATVLIGGGLLALVIFFMRDMGLLDAGDPPAPPAAPARSSSNGGDPHPSDGSAEPSGSSRRGVSVPRPERLRGQRRRLR